MVRDELDPFVTTPLKELKADEQLVPDPKGTEHLVNQVNGILQDQT